MGCCRSRPPRGLAFTVGSAMGSRNGDASSARGPQASDKDVLERLLGVPASQALLEQPEVLRAVRLLAEQVHGIDYATIGLGWHHPRSRTDYRERCHSSFAKACSLKRTEASLGQLKELVGSEGVTPETVVAAFIREAAVRPKAPEAAGARFEGVLAALEEELLMPLRALNEPGQNIYITFGTRSPIPKGPIDQCVADITAHVLQGDYSEWRYNNPVGQHQLSGLTEEQKAKWIESPRTELDGVVVHEGAPGELDFFWATKIGGPSHGFDYEAECLLPLLANARHKVILIDDSAWPHHPCGRAHLRLLWTSARDPAESKPVMWVEGVHADFQASVNRRAWQPAVLQHLLTKAVAIGALVSWDTGFKASAEAMVKELGVDGRVELRKDALVLRASNGVVEASDYLSHKHDWVQMQDEVVGPFSRCVFIPASAGV